MSEELFQYQHAGADFLARNPRSGLWDEMGVGKTAQAIVALDRIKASRVVVVCPAAVKDVWVGEMRKFSNRKLWKYKDIHDLKFFLAGKTDALVMSYEAASKWAPKLENEWLDAVILDEAHYLKSPLAQRTRAILGANCDGRRGLAKHAAHVWFLTGTPVPNDPADAWTFLRFTGCSTDTYASFCRRYFKIQPSIHKDKMTLRPEMRDELTRLLKWRTLRRTKADIGMQLPPVHLTSVSVDGNSQAIRDLLRGHPGLETAIAEAVERGGLSFLEAQHVGTLRRLIGEAKAPAFAKLLLEELDSGLDKMVVMVCHRRPLEIIKEALDAAGIGCVTFDGHTPEKVRVDAVKMFQNNPACRVFIGNVKAAGTGLTLTAASEITMLESSWSPADNAQALMRVHRIGQTRNVRARFISLSGSLDETVTETLRRKTAEIAKLDLEMGPVTHHGARK